MLSVSVPTVNGGQQDHTVPDSIMNKLAELRREGLEGKALIHELFTDDWGAPPVGVRIQGTMDDGTVVNEYLPYD